MKGLTRNTDVMALIHATLTLVENLGMASAAEGVEDAAQLAVLQPLGCRYAQGYYFSRPVPADQLIRASRPLHAVDGDEGAIISAAWRRRTRKGPTRHHWLPRGPPHPARLAAGGLSPPAGATRSCIR